MTDLYNLCDDVLLYILSFCKVPELLKCQRTCHKLNILGKYVEKRIKLKCLYEVFTFRGSRESYCKIYKQVEGFDDQLFKFNKNEIAGTIANLAFRNIFLGYHGGDRSFSIISENREHSRQIIQRYYHEIINEELFFDILYMFNQY
jgi:hypothetical protein